MKRWKLLVVAGLALAGLFAALPTAASAACTGVSDWSDLSTAFTNGGAVALCADITAPAGDSLTVGSTAVTLDLNGFSLEIDSPADGDAAIAVATGDALTIEDTSSGTPGTLTVTGGTSAAGIGGGAGDDCGSLTIDGGTVNATSGSSGAGIGGGDGSVTGGAGCTLVINGGAVTATGVSGTGGAGIGGGVGNTVGGAGGTVTIENGSVTATGGVGAAGIGGGPSTTGGTSGGAGATVTIDGGTVTSTGETAAIGGGGGETAGGAGGSVTINGGSVTATGVGGLPSVGIGGGYGVASGAPGGDGATVQIASGAQVTASGGGEAIGASQFQTPGSFGSLTNAGDLTIPSGSTLMVPSGVTAANSGTIDLNGSLTGDGTVDNTGAIVLGSGGSVSDNGDGDGSTSLLVDPNNYGLSFNVNGGSSSAPGNMYVYAGSVSASSQSLPAGPTPPAGGTFTGWFTAASGGTQVTNGSALSSALGGSGPLAATLYAHYTGITQTITFAPLAPSATAGGSAPLSATGGGSGNPVLFSAGPGTSPADACTVSQTGLDTGTVSFAHAGTCVVDANQAASGDGTYAAASPVSQTVTVGAVASTVTLSNPATVVFGQPATLTATVTEADASTPAGTVQFQLDGQNLGAPVTVGPGGTAASSDIQTTPGAHTVSAMFTPADTSVYAPGSASTTQTVDQAASTTAVAVQPSSVTATVAPVAPGAGTPTGTVTFSVDGSAVGSATLSNGTATLAYTVPSGKTHQIAATYSGDTDFTGSSASTSRSDPTIVASLSSAHPKTHYGWYRSRVTITFTCTTAGAPLTAACPSPVQLASNGAAQSVTRTITATDGGAATFVVSGIDIDQTKPSVKLSGIRAGATYGGAVSSVRCVAKDPVSGIASCKLHRRESTSGQGLDVTTVRETATATSRAGNTATATITYRTLGLYLEGATYKDGTFLITPGHTYTIVVDGTPVRPRYVDAAPSPVSPAGNDQWFASVGRDRWAQGVTIPDGLDQRFDRWVLGVQIGSTLHDLDVQIG